MSMNTRRFLLFLASVSLIVVSCGGAETGSSDGGGGEADPLKVAFVYNGPLGGTSSWDAAHDLGRQYLEEQLGDKIEVTQIDQLEAGAESERVFEDLARQEFDVIFGTNFAFMDQMYAVAAKYPDVKFVHATGYKTRENMSVYHIGAEEGTYIEGMAAALATENGQLGYLAPFPIPEVLRLTNAYTLGAKSVNPDAKVNIVWTNAWTDPQIEKQAAESLLDAGAEAIGMQSNSPVVGVEAQRAGAKWTAFAADQQDQAPEAWLTSSLLKWGLYYVDTVNSILDGTWETGSFYGRMDEGYVEMADYGDSLTEDDIAILEAQVEKFKSGEVHALDGPVVDQDGKVQIPPGESPSVKYLEAEIDYFVEGVVGDIPQE